MTHIQKILVPSDGSPASLAALREAVRLATPLAASVEVLDVRPTEHTSLVASPPGEPALRDLDAAFEEARRALGPRASRRSERGDPLHTILAVAHGADLIVMGTHGRVGRLHALIGSVAEGVVRHAPCPVLTIREPGGGAGESFAERRHGRSAIGEASRPR